MSDLAAQKINAYSQNADLFTRTNGLTNFSVQKLIETYGKNEITIDIERSFAALKVSYLTLQQLYISSLRAEIQLPDMQDILDEIQQQTNANATKAIKDLDALVSGS